MRITYLEHSGFLVELQEKILIFDYYKGQIPEISKEKRVFVFVSHAHHDHFSKEIFKWSDKYQKITYILSDDICISPEIIETYARLKKGYNIFQIGPRQELQIDEMKIRTLRSTDQGVAFFIEVNCKIFYHAGDLNWWHWEDEGEVYNEMMRRKYQYEIDKIQDRHIDVAFVPLDSRQKKQSYLGMDYFMKHTQTEVVFPMHMWGQYEAYDWLMKNPEADIYKKKVMQVTGPQQKFDLKE